MQTQRMEMRIEEVTQLLKSCCAASEGADREPQSTRSSKPKKLRSHSSHSSNGPIPVSTATGDFIKHSTDTGKVSGNLVLKPLDVPPLLELLICWTEQKCCNEPFACYFDLHHKGPNLQTATTSYLPKQAGHKTNKIYLFFPYWHMCKHFNSSTKFTCEIIESEVHTPLKPARFEKLQRLQDQRLQELPLPLPGDLLQPNKPLFEPQHIPYYIHSEFFNT